MFTVEEAYSSTGKAEATGFSQTLIGIHQIVRHHIPEDRKSVIFSTFETLRGVALSYIPQNSVLHNHLYENLKIDISKPSLLVVHT
jgi:hypothetical protein